MSLGNKIRVIITDDHKILREGLQALLERYDDIEVVGEACNGQEVLALLEEMQADVVLMDINMPVMDGYEATRQICARFPEVKVLALSVLYKEQCVNTIITSGASGYLLKSAGKEELRMAIQLVHRGTPFISSDISLKMLGRKTSFAEESDKLDTDERHNLSKRELEVLCLIAEGYTNSEIAEKLFTSKRTIETHRQNILDKTKAKNTANLIKYAFLHNLIPLHTLD
ncbi:response regulator transcription factor [Pontibacter sp. H249]|uniref:response regulator transcription factor n=1 Tax=Pontibacter sp. H249 TaxID=3133420 RepID=UPI0030BC41BF